MTPITYLKGDATCPQSKGVKLVCHVCNDIGGWGKDFVLTLSRRWSEPEAEYRAWYKAGKDGGFGLGEVQFVQVEKFIWVASMVAQRGTKTGSSGPPIRYDALESCLGKVAEKAAELGATAHMPHIGCGLAGGDWTRVEPIFVEQRCARGVNVTVYDFE